MDSSTWELFGASALILALLGVAGLIDLRNRRILKGAINPKPKINLAAVPKAEQQERAAFVLRQAHDLNQLPRGASRASLTGLRRNAYFRTRSIRSQTPRETIASWSQ